MADVTADLAGELDLPVDAGALLQLVEEDGPADKAGLRAGDTEAADQLVTGGDIIVAIDGKKTNGSEDVAAIVAGKQPGDTITIEYYRGDDKRSVEVKLGERPEQLAAEDTPQEPETPQDPDQPESPEDNGGDELFPAPVGEMTGSGPSPGGRLRP